MVDESSTQQYGDAAARVRELEAQIATERAAHETELRAERAELQYLQRKYQRLAVKLKLLHEDSLEGIAFLDAVQG